MGDPVPRQVSVTGALPVAPASASLKDLVEEVLAGASQPRPARYDGTDPFANLLVERLSQAVEQQVADGETYRVEGSAGKGNWAETPWVSVFDRLVTESAQQGYYVVYLFRSDGAGFYLSLNQGTTAVKNAFGSRYREVLATRADSYASYLTHHEIDDLARGQIGLGGRTPLTRGYEAGSVVAQYYDAAAVPGDADLAGDLRRFLYLYQHLVAAISELEAETAPDTPQEAVSGTEARRYRWHLQAEGRNRRVVRDAKRLQGYRCCVCDVDFKERFGKVGERCIEAHHLVPFAVLDDRPKQLDPRRDFAIVCANCHRMLHSQTPPVAPADLKVALGTA